MNVLFVTGEYPPSPGGISDYTGLLVDTLRHAGTCTRVMSVKGSHADLTVERWSWRTAGLIRREIARQDVGIVHIQYQTGAFHMHPVINVLPRLLPGLPVVTTFHDLLAPYLFPKAGRLRNLSVNRLARWSDGVTVTNPADRRQLELKGIRVHEIPIGPSLPPADTDREPGSHVGYFGYPSRQKGFDVLVRALGRIDVRKRPTLTIIGSFPPDEGAHGFHTVTEAESIASRHQVRLNWTGRLSPEDASNALADCGTIAFPFPGGATLRSSALIAAVQSGRPVIATHPRLSGDLRELADMSNVYLVPAGESQPVADMIQRLTSRPTVDHNLPGWFRWESIAERHQSLYASLLGEVDL
jgi:glycosyltransferase involved in cell wall biosynthesis